jgi:hypothetical protein
MSTRRRLWAFRWRLRVTFVLPIRWLRRHFRDVRNQEQKCKRCGQRSEIDFIVSDPTWAAVVPTRWCQRELCLSCFDGFANDRGLHVVRVFLVNGP